MHKWTVPLSIKEKVALVGAVRRLEAANCWLDSHTGVAMWSAPEADRHTVLTVEMIKDAKLIQGAPWKQAFT
jgi:hypothetical protein